MYSRANPTQQGESRYRLWWGNGREGRFYLGQVKSRTPTRRIRTAGAGELEELVSSSSGRGKKVKISHAIHIRPGPVA